MTEPTIITVRGQAVAESAPERATVELALAFDGAERESIRANVQGLHERCVRSVTALPDHRGGPIVEWSSDQLRVWGERPWNSEGNRLPVVFHAAAKLLVVFSDVEAMSVWIDEMSALDGVTVDGIRWDVTETTRRDLTTRAQKEAIADAVGRASVYAAALGLGPLSPLSVGDPGLLSGGEPFAPAGTAPIAMRGGVPSSGIELTPGRIRIEVEIHARFASQPA